MAEGTENGARLLIDDIDDLLKTAKLSAAQRLSLKAHRYALTATIETRKDILAINNSRAMWIDRHPRAAAGYAFGALLLATSDAGKPLFDWLAVNVQTILRLVGI